MKLLLLLVLVCFVLYEVLQVEGKSKHDVAKKLLQKYIHHHKHHHHHHKHHHLHYHHHHHHHHHHRPKHHHHHKQKSKNPHHKHWHPYHNQKSFHQKLVDKLKKEKQEQPQQNVSMKTTKRESLPKLLFSLGKGFMKLGKDLDKKKSPTTGETPTIKHTKNAVAFYVNGPTSKSIAATEAAIPFFTPSPTSAYFNENDVKDDIGADALTPAYTQPTPTASQKETPPIIDETQSNNHERKKHDLKKQGLLAITPTPSSKLSAKPTGVSSSKTKDEQTFMGEMKPTNRALQNPTMKPKLADSHLNKKNTSVEFNSQSDKDIDKNQDVISGRKIPRVKEEDIVPNPSIEIPAGQASLLEQSPTESSIDGRQDKDESPQTEYENQFTTFRATSGNTNPNTFVSEPNINEDATLLVANATQNTDEVMGSDKEDDIAANHETKGARPVNIGDRSVEPKVWDTIDKPDGDHADGTLQGNGETKKQPAIISNGNSNIEPKAEEIKGAISDEIMDGEVPPAELHTDHNTVFDSAANDISPPKSFPALSQDSASSIDGTAQPYSQESASASDDFVKSPAHVSIDGPAETTPQSDSTTDEIAQSDSAEEALPQVTTSEPVGNIDGVTQTTPQSDSQKTLPKQKSDSTTNGANQPAMQSGNSVDQAVPASNDGPQNSLAETSSRGNGDDIRGGTAQPSRHSSETFKDASKPLIGSTDNAAVAPEPLTHSETEGDPHPSVGSDDTADSVAQSSIHDTNYDVASQPIISSKSTDKLAQTQNDDLNHASYGDRDNDHQSKGSEYKTSSHQSDSNLDNASASPSVTDTTVDLPEPPYQSNLTSDETYSLRSHSRDPVVPTSGSEDNKDDVAQSLDGSVDEAVNPTGDPGKKNLDASPQQRQNEYINPDNVEVRPEEQKTPKVIGSRPPIETGVIEDGEVPPPVDNIDAATSVPPKTQGFYTEHLYDSVI